MDKYELRYKWEENKRTILSGIGLAAGLVLIGSGVLMLTRTFLYNETSGPEIVLADHLLVQNSEGALDLYSIEENEQLDTLPLPEVYLLGSNQNLDQAYVYDKTLGSLSKIGVKDSELQFELVHAFDEEVVATLSEAVSFKTTDDRFAFHTLDEFVVLDENNQTHTIDLTELDELKEAAEMQWNLSQEGLFYSLGDFLSYVDTRGNETTRIELGDKTTRIHPNGQSMMVHNNFGSALGKSVIFRLQPTNLQIEEMKNLPSAFYTKVDVPGDENQLVFLDIERNMEGSVIRKQLIVQNAVSVEDEEVNKPIILDLTAGGEYLESHVLASNGFLYNYEQEQSSVGVTELRNGRQFKAVTITDELESNPFFLPVYNK